MSDFMIEPDAPLDADATPAPPLSLVPTDQPTVGCMACKAQRSYTVEPFANGNTGWRCTVCGKILRLLPGQYLPRAPRGGESGGCDAPV